MKKILTFLFTLITVIGFSQGTTVTVGGLSGASVANADSLNNQAPAFYLNRVNHTGVDSTNDIHSFQDSVTANTNVTANTTHRSSDGSDHTFIDQNVISGSSPTFDGANITGVNADTLNGDIDVSQVTGAISAVNVADSLKSGITDSLLINTNALIVRTTGQIGMGIGIPNASSLLDMTSTTKGFLPPRMTDTQRDAISTPAEGLQIHDNVNNVPNFYDGTEWRRFSHTTAASLEEGGVVISEKTNGSALITDSANFFWDNSSKELGIGTSTPDSKLHIHDGHFTTSSSSGYANANRFSLRNIATSTGLLEWVALNDANGFVRTLMAIEHTGNVGIGTTSPDNALDVNGFIEYDNKAITLGSGVTTFAATSNGMTITGDGGANTIATITGVTNGGFLTLIFIDGLVTITDDDTHAADSIDLNASFTSADDVVLRLEHDGVSWYEVSRSTN